MKQYNLLPQDWDYESKDFQKNYQELRKQNIWCVTEIEEIRDYCGALLVGRTPLTKSNAIAYAKSVKEKFPYVQFILTEGTTFGNQELVQEF